MRLKWGSFSMLAKSCVSHGACDVLLFELTSANKHWVLFANSMISLLLLSTVDHRMLKIIDLSQSPGSTFEDLDQDIREMIRSIQKEAEAHARYIERKHERQEARYNGGVRPSGRSSNRLGKGLEPGLHAEKELICHTGDRNRSPGRHDMRDGGISTPPEPRRLNAEDMDNLDYFPPMGRPRGLRNRHRPSEDFVRGTRYEAAREEPGIDEQAFEDGPQDVPGPRGPYAGFADGLGRADYPGAGLDRGPVRPRQRRQRETSVESGRE
ncbi:MAG: hypothetical protein Q9223_005143 [Gallowayella weberi]